MKQYKDMTEPELQDLMRAFANSLTAEAVNRALEKPRFVLLVFNDPDSAQYICNGHRADVIKVLREFADAVERRDTLERIPFPKTN